MVITIKVKDKQLKAFLRDVPGKIKRASEFAIKTSIMNGLSEARTRAPFKTGELILGIKPTINKTEGKLISTVQKLVPYNLWVNQNPGWRTITYPKGLVLGGRRVLPPGATSIYGQRPAHWKWTGQARFFDLTFESMVKNFPQDLGRGIARAIRGGR